MRDRGQLLSDIGLVTFLMLTFITITFMSKVSTNYFENVVMLLMVFLIILITYFTNFTFGLIANGIIVFFYFTYIIYLSLVENQTVQPTSFVWIILIPLFTVSIALFSRSTLTLQNKAKVLEEERNALAVLDQLTGLKNIRAFNNDAKIFMDMAERGQITLTLMAIDFRFYKEISRILGEDVEKNFLKKVIEIIQESLRIEDSLYLIDQEEMIWGVLLITNAEGAEIVSVRLKEEMKNHNFKPVTDPYDIIVDLRTGDFEYKKGEKLSPLEFIAKAKAEMTYDVG